MLTITLEVDAPLGQAQGIKEELAAHLERFGDVKVRSILEKGGEQITLAGERSQGGVL